MALPSSGQISLNQVNVELGLSGTAQISMNDSAVRTLFDVASGEIEMSDGYGKANEFSFTISSNTQEANLSSLASSAGWNGSTALICNINSGIYVWSDDGGDPGLLISGSYPGGVTVNNSGYIMGRGGESGGYYPADRHGTNGGPAIHITTSSSVTINNNSGGYIAGGGGGGATTDGGGGAGGGNALGGQLGNSYGVGGAIGQSGTNGIFPYSGVSTGYDQPGRGGGAGGGGGGYSINGGYGYPANGGGGGRILPGTGGAGGAGLYAGGAGGSAGGTGGSVAQGGGCGGGGWGAAGGSSNSYNGGSGGAAISGNSRTLNNSGTVYGST